MNGTTTSPCPCAQAQDPQVVSNPPGLAQISNRADDFTGFRRALLRNLPGEQSIGAWRPTPGDLGLQVLEWWAYLADVLTFYNERIANESYLRTAQRPGSLANLVALLGYQPAPAIAATGHVAALRTPGSTAEPLAIPAGMRLSSVATPGLTSQTFEVGTAASFTGPSIVPVTLEPDTTLELANGAPSGVLLAGPVSGINVGDSLVLLERDFAGQDDNWSVVTVTALTPAPDPATGTINTQVAFSSAGWGPTSVPPVPSGPPPPPPIPILFPGPIRLPFPSPILTILPGPVLTAFPGQVFGTFSRPPAVLFSRPTAAALTRPAIPIRLPSPLRLPVPAPGPAPAPAPAPARPRSSDSTSYRLVRPTAAATLFNAAALNAPTTAQAVVPAAGSAPLTVHLSAAVRAISPGDIVLFDDGSGSPLALAVVTATSDALYTAPYPTPAGLSAPNPPDIVIMHTALGLATADGTVLCDANDPSRVGSVTVRYAFKDVGTIIGVPATGLPGLPAAVAVPSAYTPPPGGTTALLQDANGTGVLVTVSAAASGQATPAGAGTPPSTIQVTLAGAGTPPTAIPATAPLVAPLELLLDLLPVSRGTTVTGEVLGSGNAALAGQSFTLSKSPLTYLASGNGAVSTLAVYVDGVEWHEVPSFYGQAANARVFVVSRSADQAVTTVTFGDGVNGARLTSGTGNVTASYRYGAGAASPPAGSLTTISQPQPGLASVRNPVAVSGGADAQSADDVRANAPASVFTFGRAISATDYQIVAAHAPGVNRAAASWTFDGTAQRTLVTVFVGDDQAAAAAASAALAGAEDPNRPVQVVAANPIELGLSCTLVVAADRQVPVVVSAAIAAISDPAAGLFSPGRMGIGQRLYRSAVAAALTVPGVVAVHNLTVTWPVSGQPGVVLLLGDVFDPGEGSFFELAPGSVAIVGVNAGA